MTFKQKMFAKKYVENGGNGTKAALAVYNTDKYQTAQAIASENLLKPEIAQSIDDIAKSEGIDSRFIFDNFKRVAVQEAEKYTGDTILKANIELAKILRLYPATKHERLNINVKGNVADLNFNDVKKELKVIDSELNTVLEDTPTNDKPIIEKSE